MKPNLALLIPLGAIGLAIAVLLVLGARALGKRRRPWLTEGNH